MEFCSLKVAETISTLVFSVYTIGGAATQIFEAVKDDIMEACGDLRLSLSCFASSVSNKLTAAFGQVYDNLNVCAAKEGEVSKSRLAVLVESTVERWGSVTEVSRTWPRRPWPNS